MKTWYWVVVLVVALAGCHRQQGKQDRQYSDQELWGKGVGAAASQRGGLDDIEAHKRGAAWLRLPGSQVELVAVYERAGWSGKPALFEVRNLNNGRSYLCGLEDWPATCKLSPRSKCEMECTRTCSVADDFDKCKARCLEGC